ncbi:MAG: SDR family NAD(P)-dependent oxidoreductase [Spirochaetaceae bacterium]|nr:MAG: SDR family NAD(P)-dependent oxidoreductase [Spirochaetaceae bacterium]
MKSDGMGAARLQDKVAIVTGAGGGGSIVNIASIAARVGGSVSCVYPASKAGVVALSKNTAL